MSQPQDIPHIHGAEEYDRLTEHPEKTHVALADAIDRFIQGIGKVVWWSNALLIAVIILQVVLRYGFDRGLVVFEELQWHLYALAVMMGVSFALTNDAHIRVDVLHQRFSPRAKRVVEIVGILIFLLPFVYIVFDHSIDFLADSWRNNERSDAPTGLPWRWAIKAVIPLSFGLLGLAAISRLIRDVTLLIKGEG